MNIDKSQLLLYAVTDSAWTTASVSLFQQVEEAIKGGVTCIQLREKDLPKDKFVALGKEIKQLTTKYQIPLIINDDVDVAIAIDADGVHVGQSDMEVGEVRTKLGPDKILGVSAHSIEEAVIAEKQGADYLGVGAVFTTSTKQDANHVSITSVQEISRAVSIPIVAIGGIQKENIEQLKGSEIAGVAVVSAIFAKKDISKAASELKNVLMQVIES